jgi:hypothetical protein
MKRVCIHVHVVSQIYNRLCLIRVTPYLFKLIQFSLPKFQAYFN